MEENKSKPLSLIEKMKLRAKEQKTYGGEMEQKAASMDAVDCPNCGAGRAKHDGLTACAYCGFSFLSVTLSDGLFLKKEDNSH